MIMLHLLAVPFICGLLFVIVRSALKMSFQLIMWPIPTDI